MMRTMEHFKMHNSKRHGRPQLNRASSSETPLESLAIEVTKSHVSCGDNASSKFVSGAKVLTGRKFHFKFLVLSDCVE